MRRAAIVSPIRTAVGKFQGSLVSLTAGELGAVILRALMERTGVDPGRVDDVIFAQGYGNGEAPCIARWSALAADFPISVPGYQLDRRCGSGLQAVIDAAMMVQTGVADVVIAGGVESMSNVEYYSLDMRSGARAGSVTMHDRLARGRVMSQPIERFGVISGMIETADNLARDYQISREECDAYAAMSHQRAAAAWAAGKFDDELVPVSVKQKKGDPILFAKDEGVRPDATPESLSQLRPIEKGGVVTAGNASQQNDAAAACLVVAEDKLAELNLDPMGWFVSWAAAGCDPSRMGIGPVPAVERLFARTGMSWDDIDLVELNEAFAPQVLAVLRGWGWDDRDRLNVNGSGISLGHPIGATGGRILANLLRELDRRKGRYGLETMCIGGGQGIAAIFERP
ncbi:MAG: acetyl-CoA C-acetyltransferase [Phenylobacterium sp.]|uniref:acetyl-CoA C-acetyltransferase n=3 Tax=Phenylobacterium sp. TaxID=1871053 RepID=UPI0025D3449C|nr:acetyl-CoA C-acetyltransferase [Phenylobacterium sp.]MCA6223390.1 acetyl-CoA C-acetyltransferase [Phenylobacterium sp.]MCA6226787.1 acetyl-CoA C-acetyltransferase [Phenylobacterium sp.]MCA6233344.1 acetyl-CoA C-acetyltransferase [Phenylobacterium sp.]MCA6234899.1 acetyl-CoA C-acetyltransferase [Phenylobacterium sp.]MCA6248620.1 acetyl-CoA C-acetyltransferase [Phenylobacterium sp.]